MPLELSDGFRTWATRKHMSSLWGQPIEIEPYLVKQVLGDGMRLLGLTTINSRPNYYLILIDSSWNESSWSSGDTVSEHLEEILEAIEDEVGNAYYLDDEDEPVGFPWPALDDSMGCSWWDDTDLLKTYERKFGGERCSGESAKTKKDETSSTESS